MVAYAYDSEGRLQTLTLPSGNTITYAYRDGKVTSLTLNGSTTILSNVLYQPFGPRECDTATTWVACANQLYRANNQLGTRDKVMKFTTVCVAMFLAACSGSGRGAEASQSMPKQTDQGRVYYYEFGIERTTGLHENEIEQYGTKLCISRSDFEKSLSTDPEYLKNLQYNKLDIRAKIVFSDKQYLIDRAGVASSEQGYELLDKKEFVGHLKSSEKC